MNTLYDNVAYYHGLLQQIRKRAGHLDDLGDPSAIGRFAYPVDGTSAAFANQEALDSALPTAAIFVITDSEVDRDGDRVNPHGIHFENWRNAGAPWFFQHQQWPVPIGTSINPETGQLDVWVEGDKVKARCHFDMEDPNGRYLAGKVSRGLLKGVSVAFVPIRANPRDPGVKAHHNYAAHRGFDFHEVDMTEVSIVGTPANPRALLDGPPKIAKAIRCCANGKCFTRYVPNLEIRKSMGSTDMEDYQDDEDEQDRLDDLGEQLKASCDDLERAKRQVLDKAVSMPTPLSRNDLAILKSSISELMDAGLSYESARSMHEARLEMVRQSLHRLRDAEGNVQLNNLASQLGLSPKQAEEMLRDLDERGALRGVNVKLWKDAADDDWQDDVEFNPDEERISELTKQLEASLLGVQYAKSKLLPSMLATSTQELRAAHRRFQTSTRGVAR